MNKKIIIIVQNSNKYPSNLMIPFIKKTWGNNNEIKTIIYQGDSTEDNLDSKNILRLKIPGDYEHLTHKLLHCIQWIDKNLEYDYILRTTTTTYIDIDNLKNLIKTLPPSNLYHSTLVTYPPFPHKKEDEIIFGSGTGTILSKDIVKLIINNLDKWDYTLLDDVAMGKLLTYENNIKLTIGSRQDFKNYPTQKNIDFNNYLFRYKLSDNLLPRFLEIFIILTIHLKILNHRKQNLIRTFLIHIIDMVFILIFNIFYFFNFKRYIPKLKILRNRMLAKIFLQLKKIKFMQKYFKKIKSSLKKL
tara:strand:- start:3303 stop:4208 length:906 start_codon:yes stop_codon:yes gene_type:complete